MGGVLNEDGTQSGPDGRIAKTQDCAKLNKSGKTYGFTTKLGVEWKGISFIMMIANFRVVIARLTSIKSQHPVGYALDTDYSGRYV